MKTQLNKLINAQHCQKYGKGTLRISNFTSNPLESMFAKNFDLIM